MGTEVATRSRTEMAQESAYDPFAMAGNDMAGASALYAKFNGNSGEFTYGANATEIEKGERMAADVFGARRGWICWVESEVAEEIMVAIPNGNPPAEHTLTDHGPYKKYEDGTEDGWSSQFAINFRLLGEDHDGVEITYKTSTKSALRPLGDLVKQYGREYKMNPGKIPIVELDKGSYMPREKKHGKKYFPIFKIVDWIDEEELLAQYGDGHKVEEGDENDNLIEQQPVKKAETKKAAEPKKVTKAEKPAETKKVEAAAPAEEEDEDERALREMQERIAAKKAAAAQAAAEAEAASADEGAGEEAAAEEEAEKPAPAATRTRRRSF